MIWDKEDGISAMSYICVDLVEVWNCGRRGSEAGQREAVLPVNGVIESLVYCTLNALYVRRLSDCLVYRIVRPMAATAIAPPAGMTNRDVIRYVFDGPRWQSEAARAFRVSTRQVRRLQNGRLTMRHYFIIDQVLRTREQVTPLIVVQDKRRAEERGRKRIEGARERRAKITTPVLARFA